MKEVLYLGLAKGDIGLRPAIRQMRIILGMPQKEYAKKVARISPRILSEFESDVSLTRIFFCLHPKPFYRILTRI